METVDHNRQKKVAVINDFCGFGRCSLAVALPIISAMKVQCCPLPTSIFSNHTGFQSFAYTDYTENIPTYMKEWEKLKLSFQGIATGFLGSAQQIEMVKEFLKEFKTEKTKVLVDPVMGDYGKLYATYSAELAGRMHELVPYADLLTPNLTEACILTETAYREEMTEEELYVLCEKLSAMGPDNVVISGINYDSRFGNFVYEKGKAPEMLWTDKIGENRSGTGDVFCAVLTADMVNGVPLRESVQKAADYIGKTIKRTIELGIPVTDGICFEEYLYQLGDWELRKKNKQ